MKAQRIMLRGALLGATVLGAAALAPRAAQAQPFDGVYVGAGAGYNFRDSIDTRSGPPGAPNQKIQPDNGFAGLGSLGYGFGNGFRVEVEGNYRQSFDRRITGTGFPTISGGKISTYGAMANVLFDMDVGLPWAYPYLGVGAGYAWTKLDRNYNAGVSAPYLFGVDGTEGNFAFQAMAGVSFPIPDVPGLSVTAEYRFFSVLGDETGTAGVTLPAGYGPASARSTVATRFTLRDQFNHSALLGLRYAFDVSPPPPPPTPAPTPVAAPARSYLVFFDWDRANLTERARQIIREAADNSTRVQYTSIEVNGYTDTSGTPRYNQGLSIRRAQAVAAELVRDGVPRQSISIQGFGETHLLVPTGPGVREPQNRRVEIIIR
jgi:outer membrane protein OmpA-like peptidoglycan-associated protein